MASIVISGDTSGSITVAAPAVAGSNTISLPAVTGTAVIAGQNSAITAGTAVATTSGTSVNFTSIPSWVKRITVMFNGVSTNGTSSGLIQLGSGSTTTTGYTSSSVVSGAGTAIFSSTSGFIIYYDQAVFALSGTYTFNLLGSNVWVGSHTIILSNSYAIYGGGNITLSGTLDRLRLTTVNGTDVFDAGSVNILYE